MLNLFNEPFNPEKSIYLNAKYWDNASYTYLNLLEDAENYLSLDQYLLMIKTLRRIDNPVLVGKNFYKLIRRVIKLHQEKNSFGLMHGKITVEKNTIQNYLYSGMKSRESYPITIDTSSDLQALSETSVRIYEKLYGRDITKQNRNIRFASPDNCVRDILDYGAMSDYHFDERKGITTVVYLSEVDIDSGPFQYIKHSELIEKSTILTAIGQFVCFDLGVQKPNQMNNLPFEFRQTPSIGNFLEEWKIKILDENKITLNGGPGTYVMFNGQNILHRGGKPLAKDRLAIFLQPEGMLTHKLRSLTSCFRSRLYLGISVIS